MPPDRTHPLMVLYDGHCSLCVRSAAGLTRLDRDRQRLRMVDFRAHPEAVRASGISEAAMEGAMHAVHPDGRVSKGPEAVRDALRAAGLGPASWVLGLPLIGPVFARFYDVIARNRLRWFGRKSADSCAGGACRIDHHP